MIRTLIKPQPIDNITSNNSALAFHRKPTKITFEVMRTERRPRDFTPGEMVMRPAGLDWAIRYHKDAAVSVLALPTQIVRNVLDDPSADFEDAIASFDVRPFWSPLLSELVRRLDTEVFETLDASPLLLDTLLHTICWEIWTLARCRDPGAPDPSGPVLSARDLRNIDQYVDETCISKVDFAALGRLTNLPGSQVSAAFKRTVGQTPYQYILARRVKRARSLIETSTLSLSEIAYRCGFSSQAHLTDTMRNKLGATPGALRKAAFK